jgi:hypothetical protein
VCCIVCCLQCVLSFPPCVLQVCSAQCAVRTALMCSGHCKVCGALFVTKCAVCSAHCVCVQCVLLHVHWVHYKVCSVYHFMCSVLLDSNNRSAGLDHKAKPDPHPCQCHPSSSMLIHANAIHPMQAWITRQHLILIHANHTNRLAFGYRLFPSFRSDAPHRHICNLTIPNRLAYFLGLARTVHIHRT